MACRKSIEASDRQDKGDHDGLPAGTEKAIQSNLKQRRNLELIGDMILVAAAQKVMCQAITATTRQVPVLLMESLCPATAVADREVVQQLQRTDSGKACFKEVVADEV